MTSRIHTVPSGYGGCERCLLLGSLVVLYVDGDDERMCEWCADRLEAAIAREDALDRADLEQRAREPAMVEV